VFFAHLVEDGNVARNPVRSTPGARERIKLPAAHREMDYLRLEEIPCYLDACDDVYQPLAETLIATGRRRAARGTSARRARAVALGRLARPAQARARGRGAAPARRATPPPLRGWPPGCR
jgi:hypothetical protein